MFDRFQLRISIPTSPTSPLSRAAGRLRSSRRPRLVLLVVISALLCAITFSLIRAHEPTRQLYDAAKDELGLSGEWGEWGDMADIANRFGVSLEKGKAILGLNPCLDWDPSLEEERDPAGCLKARQYRQVQRVLRREEKGEHGHWWFTQKTNVQTLERLSQCFLPTDHDDYTTCPDRPVVVNGYWWSALTILNGTSGESIWQESVLKQFESYGIMTLFVGDYPNWIAVAEMMPDVYRFIWAPETEIISCFTDPRCVAAEHYTPPHDALDMSVQVPDEERGVIPIWRLQIVDYWGSQPKEISNNDYYWGLTEHGEWSYHPLGAEWIQVPWPMPGHIHLPYSIEEYCLKLPVKPHAEREDSVLMFAKRSSYFHLSQISPIGFWTDLSREPNFTLLSTAEVEEGKPMPDGVETMGRQSREAYEGVVGGAKVLLGIGFPPISPSVYTALSVQNLTHHGSRILIEQMPGYTCGITVPLFHFQSEEGRLVDILRYQHGPAMVLGAPYVYSYQKDNYTQLLEMVNTALVTPIERYIPDDMRLTYALAQSKAFLNRDLHGMFRKVLRKNGGRVPKLKAGVRERCEELKRCRAPLDEGRSPSTPRRMRALEVNGIAGGVPVVTRT